MEENNLHSALLAVDIFMFVLLQKLMRHQDAKSVEEKAARIKEWVMLKLSEVKKL